MQGWRKIISTEEKVAYLNALLKVGFDTLDFGSFVSPKAIPQMADTDQVVVQLDDSPTKLLAIVANQRGAESAVRHAPIRYLGYPFSVSETFQQRNTNAGIEASVLRVEEIQNLCLKTGRELVVYISMGFGNPYGDLYSEEIVFEWVNRLVGMDINIISLADTVGLATAEQVFRMTAYLVESLPGVEVGVHLHAGPDNWREKLDAAFRAGCRRFDGALGGSAVVQWRVMNWWEIWTRTVWSNSSKKKGCIPASMLKRWKKRTPFRVKYLPDGFCCSHRDSQAAGPGCVPRSCNAGWVLFYRAYRSLAAGTQVLRFAESEWDPLRSCQRLRYTRGLYRRKTQPGKRALPVE
jgi:hydroxymethylglutaryl-CoA lyase